jgi:hypothetical protein
MSNEIIKPTDGFLRDGSSGAIINVDSGALSAYKLRKNAESRKENEINTMKEEMKDIKNMLSQILEKINK